MPDREKVLFALDCYAEQRTTCGDECPYFTRIAVGFGGHGYGYCAKTNIARDAIALIEQKPVKPIKKLGVVESFKCGACEWVLGWVTGFPLYCPRCGRKVDWNA